MPDQSAQKYQAALQLLATGRMVRFLFDAAGPGVEIPEGMKSDGLVIMDFGNRAPTPIDDLKCDATGIGGTLRFGSEYIWCFIPWVAVVGMAPHGPTPAQRAWTPMVLTGGKEPN